MSKKITKILLTSIYSGLTVIGGILLYLYYKEKKQENLEHEILMDEISENIAKMNSRNRDSCFFKS